MSQRTLMIFFAIGMVAVLGVATLVNYGITTSIVAAAQLTGPAGADGADGRDGEDGADGAVGPQGPAGADGAPGTTGSSRQGPAGAAGPVGPSGAPGAPGADGQDAEVTPPIVVNTGPMSGTMYQGTSIVATTLTAPAGSYALSLGFTDAVGVQTSGGGTGAIIACTLSPSNLEVYVEADGLAHDALNSVVFALATETTITVSCYTFYYWSTVVTDYSWANLTITATRLD